VYGVCVCVYMVCCVCVCMVCTYVCICTTRRRERVGFFLGSVKRPCVQLSSPGRQKGSRLVAEEWVDGGGVRNGWMGGWRNGWIGGQREKVRGVYGFSSLMKQK
jgi:hypothetical protein